MEYLAEAVDALIETPLRQRRRRRVGPRRPGQGAQDVLADRASPSSSSTSADDTDEIYDLVDGRRHRRYYEQREAELGAE